MDHGKKIESPGTTFDFDMVPHRASVATARPVKFRVVFNSTKMAKVDIETFVYHLCYYYYGFGGGVKVPAACMYAQKLLQRATEHAKGRGRVSMVDQAKGQKAARELYFKTHGASFEKDLNERAMKNKVDPLDPKNKGLMDF